jgi:ABC-type transporter Mla maintaining outer membrane lipid asymmetry ATPase subunit MlaF
VTPVLELSAVIKDYRGLRPLRIDHLAIEPGEQLAVLGFDRPSAEVLINLITGTTLPDRGDIRVFGQSTAAIRDSAEWMAIVDRFGLVTERAVLLDVLSVVQNLAVPFSLDIEPPGDDVRSRAVALALEVGLDEAVWDRRVADLDATSRARVRLGRALALDPSVVLFEHPSASIPRAEIGVLGRGMRAVVERRGVAAVTLTADRDFAAAVAGRVLTLDPSTGRLTRSGGGWLTHLAGSLGRR